MSFVFGVSGLLVDHFFFVYVGERGESSAEPFGGGC